MILGFVAVLKSCHSTGRRGSLGQNWAQTVKNFRPQNAKKRTVLINSAGHTNTADSEHGLFPSWCFCRLFFSFFFFYVHDFHGLFIVPQSIYLSVATFVCWKFTLPPTLYCPLNNPGGDSSNGSRWSDREQEGRRRTSSCFSVWWCRTLWWPRTETPLRSHLEKRRSRLKTKRHG